MSWSYHVCGFILKDNINIVDFRLGRGEEGYALAVILLDENISKDIIAKISNLSNCVWAHYAVLYFNLRKIQYN